MEPRYRLVIFDFDGTLADSFPWFLRVFNEVADRFRFRRIEEGEVETLRGYSGREMMRHLRVPFWKLPWIARHMRRLKTRDLHTISLFPGVDALLERLADSGVELAIVSSNADVNVRGVLGPGNAARVRYWECGASIFGKRASFRRVLRRSGVAPAEALCVGDEIRDLEAARGAGIPFGAVTWGYTTEEALRARSPEAVFRSLDDVVDTVTGAAARR
ncbi:MAG TPA: HAD hydrolase-like protein [Longimicrobiaceae bacterium]|nr:HAD hydrolase-like protein [Longimicrobiaceae bacterium]